MVRKEHIDDSGLSYFMKSIRAGLGENLIEVVLFGSRARGDAGQGSDFDCLVVVDHLGPEVVDVLDNVAGEVLYRFQEVISAFPIEERRRKEQIYNPLLMNVEKEGVLL